MRFAALLFLVFALIAMTLAVPVPKCKPLPAHYCDGITCSGPQTAKACDWMGLPGQFQFLPHGRTCGCCPECIQVKDDP